MDLAALPKPALLIIFQNLGASYSAHIYKKTTNEKIKNVAGSALLWLYFYKQHKKYITQDVQFVYDASKNTKDNRVWADIFVDVYDQMWKHIDADFEHNHPRKVFFKTFKTVFSVMRPFFLVPFTLADIETPFEFYPNIPLNGLLPSTSGKLDYFDHHQTPSDWLEKLLLEKIRNESFSQFLQKMISDESLSYTKYLPIECLYVKTQISEKIMDSNKPSISICIPLYNRGVHLFGLLENLKDFGLHEILIGDFNSTDFDLKEMEFEDNVKLLTLPGKFNIATGLHECALKATGDMIVFCDVDLVFGNSVFFQKIKHLVVKNKTFYAPTISTSYRKKYIKCNFEDGIWVPLNHTKACGLIAVYKEDYLNSGGLVGWGKRGEKWGGHDIYINDLLIKSGLKRIRDIQKSIYLLDNPNNDWKH